MNIIKRELKANQKSLFIWSLGVVLFVIMGMQKYIALMGDGTGEQFTDIMEGVPEIMKVIFGLSLVDITSTIGYYSVLSLYLALLICTYSVLLGVKIIYKEERDKTGEFLYTRPIKRNKAMAYKMISAVILVFTINFISLISSYFGVASITTEIMFLEIFKTSLGLMFMSYIFLAFGFMIATINIKKIKLNLIATIYILFGFVTSILSLAFQELEFLKYVSPFSYFDAKNIIVIGFDLTYILLGGILIFVYLIISFLSYNKRDLNI